MTPSISPSLPPTNKLKSTSLISNTSNSLITTNESNTRSTSLPPNKRSSPSFNTDENDNIKNNFLNNKNSRRKGGFDWHKNTNNHIDLTGDIAQDTNYTFPDLPDSIPSSPPLPSTIPLPLSPTAEINNDDDDDSYYSSSEGQFPNLGGITVKVETIKVIQVDECHPEKNDSKIPLPKNKGKETNKVKKQRQSNNIFSTKQQKTKQNKTRIKQDNINNINNINEREFNGLVRTSSKRRKLTRSGITIYRKAYKRQQKKQEEKKVMTASTSNPFYTNDPTDMEGDDYVHIPVTKAFPWVPVNNGPPKLLHASLIPLSEINRKLEKRSSVVISKRKSVESISAPLSRRPSQIFRQNLLQQSVAMSLNESIMGRNVFISRPKPRRMSVGSISAPKPRRRLFRRNLLGRNVTMSFNETVIKRKVFISRSVRKRKSVESIVVPKPRRPSQVFRQDLLQQSVAMSLNEAVMGRNVFVSQSTHRQSFLNVNVSSPKTPRRRFSRRGSNAKFNKHRVSNRSEEQQKEQKPVNTLVIPRILEVDELKKKVDEQLRKQHLQPPPRSFTLRNHYEPSYEEMPFPRSFI